MTTTPTDAELREWLGTCPLSALQELCPEPVENPTKGRLIPKIMRNGRCGAVYSWRRRRGLAVDELRAVLSARG